MSETMIEHPNYRFSCCNSIHMDLPCGCESAVVDFRRSTDYGSRLARRIICYCFLESLVRELGACQIANGSPNFFVDLFFFNGHFLGFLPKWVFIPSTAFFRNCHGHASNYVCQTQQIIRIGVRNVVQQSPSHFGSVAPTLSPPCFFAFRVIVHQLQSIYVGVRLRSPCEIALVG